MATVSHTSLLVVLLLALVGPNSTSASPKLEVDLHLLVQLLGFPPGLIPDPVESYTLSPIGLLPPTFNFTMYFENPCYVQYVYPLYFAPVCNAKVSYGKLSEMRGHKGQLPSGEWEDMSAVTVVGDKLEFTFETTTVMFDRSQFEEIQTCKDGPLMADKLISQLPTSAE